MNLGGFSNSIGSLAGSGTVTTVAAATLTVGADNNITTFSGVLQNGAGTLALSKVGAGNLYLNGANTYTGGTTISAGVLYLSNFTTTGSIIGNITDNATLAFGRSDTGLTLSGNISGSGNVYQNGLGTSTLSGNNTYSGPTVVNAGTLQAGSTTGLSVNSDFTVTSILNLGGFTNAIGSFGRQWNRDRQRRRGDADRRSR